MADLTRARVSLGRGRRRLADWSYVCLTVALWTAATLLLALGCLLLVGILVADGHPARFFLHVQNLATHYLAAGPAARTRFHGQLAAFYIGLVLLFGTARAPTLASQLRAQIGRGGRHD